MRVQEVGQAPVSGQVFCQVLPGKLAEMGGLDILTPAMLPCGQAPSVLLVSITLRKLGVLWRRLLRS